MSKKGLLDVIEKKVFDSDNNFLHSKFVTLTEGTTPESLGYESALNIIFENGDMSAEEIFEDVRTRANFGF